MNSSDLAPQHAVGLLKNSATSAVVTVSQQARADTAANDDPAAVDLEHHQNPLWVMAIALGVFCGFAALVMAFG